MNSAEKELKVAWETYLDTVNHIAQKEFHLIVEPFVDEYYLTFHSGMGGWWIYSTKQTPKWFVSKYKDTYFNKSGYIDNDKLPNRIKDLLNMEVEGLPSNNFGSLVPDYVGRNNYES